MECINQPVNGLTPWCLIPLRPAHGHCSRICKISITYHYIYIYHSALGLLWSYDFYNSLNLITIQHYPTSNSYPTISPSNIQSSMDFSQLFTSPSSCIPCPGCAPFGAWNSPSPCAQRWRPCWPPSMACIQRSAWRPRKKGEKSWPRLDGWEMIYQTNWGTSL